MAPLILIAILAALIVLSLILVIRWILSQTSTSTINQQTMMEQFSKGISEFQAAQTHQLGAVLDRHSSDIRQILHSQSEYISRFLTGPTIQEGVNPLNPQQTADLMEQSDPANWSLAEQMEHMPKSMREEIEREQMEEAERNLLTRPSHPIRYDPRIPIIQPGHSSDEGRGAWVPPTNGSGDWLSDVEG